MHDLPGFFQGDAFALIHGQGMIGRLQLNPGTKVAVLEVSRRFEQVGAVLIIGDAGAQPAKKRADDGSVGMLPVGNEILLFLRHPDAEAELFGVIVDGDFDDAANEIIVVDDARVSGELDAFGSLLFGNAPPVVGLVRANIGPIVVLFPAGVTAKIHGKLLAFFRGKSTRTIAGLDHKAVGEALHVQPSRGGGKIQALEQPSVPGMVA